VNGRGLEFHMIAARFHY